jgi:hypothetical protein
MGEREQLQKICEHCFYFSHGCCQSATINCSLVVDLFFLLFYKIYKVDDE